MKVYTYRVSAVCGEAMGEAAVLVCNEENMPQGFANTLAATVNAPYNLIQATDGMDNIIAWQFNYTTYANNPLFVIEKKDAGSKQFVKIGGPFDTTKFSDEYCKYGEFTGTFVGLTCADRVLHKHYADFDFFEYVADEEKGMPR